MSEWSGKSKGGKSGYGFFIFLIKRTHIKVAYFFLRFVAVYFLLFTEKKPIKFYFQKIHEYGWLKTISSIYKNYCLLGEVLIDKIAILSGAYTRFTFDFEGEENLVRMAEEGKGGLLVGAHMGNFEVAAQLLERIDVKINLVMLVAEHEQIKALLDDVLVEKNIHVIPITDDYSHLFAISEAFKNNEFVVLHGDRFLPGTNTVKVDFMGKAADFPTGPLYLASKHQAPVSFVFSLKETSNHYHFYASEGKVFKYPAKLKTRKEDIKKMVEEYAASVEKIVKKYPTQWFNYFPFWDEEKQNQA